MNEYGLNIVTGGIIREEIQSVANKVNIGDKIKFKSIREKTEGSEIKTGRVIGKYPSFCLVDTGMARETILWVDMIGGQYV